MKYYFYICIIKIITEILIFLIMKEKTTKMIPKYHYDKMERSIKLKLRDEFLQKSGMSLITFYDKLRKDSFKPLERELFENVFVNPIN